jgi:hypothetical protein
MKAIMAEQRGPGFYWPLPEAELEDWEDVKSDAVSIEYLGPVTGVQAFRHAVRVVGEDNRPRVYLTEADEVAGDPGEVD